LSFADAERSFINSGGPEGRAFSSAYQGRHESRGFWSEHVNRREFLVATVAAGAAMPARALAEPSATASPLRIGQIGTGHAHASGKMAALRSLPTVWEVVGVVASAEAAASEPYRGVPVLSEEELLGRDDVKAVAVETRMEDSCATAVRFLRAGKHIHLDKPGALRHAEYKAMRLDAERRRLTVQMGYMLRYNPAFELLGRAVREGWLGEVTEIDASIGKLADPATRKALAALPGGGMFELGCHLVDAVVTLLGKPAEVHAESTPAGADGMKDNQLAVLRYAKATAVIRCNHADPFGFPRRRFNVTGTQGTFEIVPLESGKVNLSLTVEHGEFKKGTAAIKLEVPKGRYDGEFIDLAKVVRGEKALAWDAAHDIAVHETVMRAAGIEP
jgi:predicted dehydrogenase